MSSSAAPVVAAKPARGDELDQSRLSHLVGYVARRAAVEMKKAFHQHLGPLDLKGVEFSILMLVDSNVDVNQKQLGQALDLSPPNLAVILDRMVERGWVERVRSTVDRRAQLIHLTASGRALAARAEAISRTMEQEAVGVLTQAERLLLIELLQRLVDARRG